MLSRPGIQEKTEKSLVVGNGGPNCNECQSYTPSYVCPKSPDYLCTEHGVRLSTTT